MAAYIVGIISGTVCLVVSLCYLGAMGEVRVPLAVATTIVGLAVVLLNTALVAAAARGKKAPAKPAAAEPASKPEPEPEPQPDDEEVELPGIDEA